MEGHGLSREPYPTAGSDDAWAFFAPYLTLMSAGVPRRRYTLREVGAAVDRGSTGEQAAQAAAQHGMRLVVVKLLAASCCFVLLSRRWMVEPSCAEATRIRRLVNDDKRALDVVAGPHFLAFVTPMLRRLVTPVAQNAIHAPGRPGSQANNQEPRATSPHYPITRSRSPS